MSSGEQDICLKPSEILKQNKQDKEEQQERHNKIEERLQAERDYGNKFQNMVIEQKTIKDTIFHIDDKNTCIEHLNKEQLKKVFPDYNGEDEYPNKLLSSFDCKIIHDILNIIFDKHIIDLYKFVAKNKEWYNRVRAFIGFHEITDFSMYPNDLSKEEIQEIKEQGFHLFVSEKCANIPESEFDGPNDLSIEEWENLDEIILYYYREYLS